MKDVRSDNTEANQNVEEIIFLLIFPQSGQRKQIYLTYFIE